MIYIHPVGGLGNMLFHIASIYTLALDNEDELCLINIQKKIDDLKKDGRINLDHAHEYSFILDRFTQDDVEVFTKNEYQFRYEPLTYVPSSEYIGYFQSERYFAHRRTEVLNKFRPSEQIEATLNKYSPYFGSISLHIRRNDYVRLYSTVHPPQTMDYYNQAISLMSQDKKILIFTDDIAWARENFVGDRFVFIEEVDYVSMMLMTKMKYHIIANSSFSWWGAWLSTYDGKMVVAPASWFGGKKKTFDLDMQIVPDKWIRL